MLKKSKMILLCRDIYDLSRRDIYDLSRQIKNDSFTSRHL